MEKRYLNNTKHTNPEELAYLYEELPDDIGSICKVVNALLIHPSCLSKYPELKVNEDEIWNNEPRTVYEILMLLNNRNNRGLLVKRNDNEKVVITCRGFTILLVSILRYKGIPARARAGFATYICDDINIDHWICEYWDEVQERWILIDADFMKVDFSPAEFKYSANIFSDSINLKIDPLKYGYDDNLGMPYIIAYLNLDFLLLFHDELWYNPKTYITEKLNWDKCSIYEDAVRNLSEEEKELICELSELMAYPDSNYAKLNKLSKKNSLLLPVKNY